MHLLSTCCLDLGADEPNIVSGASECRVLYVLVRVVYVLQKKEASSVWKLALHGVIKLLSL